MPKLIIGVDIGGTKIAAGVVDRKGHMIETVTLPTMAAKGKKVSLEQVLLSIERLLERVNKKDVAGIGVCAPGPLDPTRGVVHNPPNLPGWRKVPLGEIIQKKFKIKTRLENDANAAGVAEMIWGAARGCKNIFYVTVSTGVGTGIIINGKLYHGKNGMAGEGGHVTINYDDKLRICGCGNAGCIEALASGPHTVKWLRSELKKNPGRGRKLLTLVHDDPGKITMETIAEAAKRKDPLAVETIKRQGKLLGIWLGNMINILDPEIIVIGGGVSMIGRPIFSEIIRFAREHTINIFASKTPIVPARLHKNVGIFGAASVFISDEK